MTVNRQQITHLWPHQTCRSQFTRQPWFTLSGSINKDSFLFFQHRHKANSWKYFTARMQKEKPTFWPHIAAFLTLSPTKPFSPFGPFPPFSPREPHGPSRPGGPRGPTAPYQQEPQSYKTDITPKVEATRCFSWARVHPLESCSTLSPFGPGSPVSPGSPMSPCGQEVVTSTSCLSWHCF